MSTGAAAYGDCVAALRSSLSFLESSVSALGTGVQDFPRLVTVLKSVRHYELIPQPTLAAAETSLRDEIGPAITQLLDRADTHIDRLERRIESLKARSELQHGRLAQPDDYDNDGYASKSKGKARAGTGRGGGSGSSRLDGEAKLRAKVVKQRKEALQYSIERLELEVGQREKELRKRLDAA